MKLLSTTLRSASNLSCRTHLPWTIRSIFTDNNLGDGMNNVRSGNSCESADDFERRIFGGALDNNSGNSSFFYQLDKLGKVRERLGMESKEVGGARSQFNGGLGENSDTLSDGIDAKLKKAATTFLYSDEIKDDGYSSRPDLKFQSGMTHVLNDLDLTKPADQKPFRRSEFETTTEEVLRKADFRNVRFLANFLTEAGLIIKRSKTRISAKAQRKVAREIKTARALGLLPFTTMGTKHFQFGKSMQDLDEDMENRNFYSQPINDYFVDKRNM
uniref:Small ribosomal subunit protein bS18c n=1 Tax=Anthurium amnicola TaxID=1678845 RepID=A0A1D1YJ77_9ARAE